MDEANPVLLQAANRWHIVEDSRRSQTALCGQVITHRGAHARLSVVGREHTCPNCIKIYEEMNPSNSGDKQIPTGGFNISEVSHSEINIGQSITGKVRGDVVGGDKIGGDKISIGQQIVNFFTGTPDQQRDLRNRQIILHRVHDFWVKGVLESSLHNEVLIELGLEEKAEAVDYPWEMVIQRPDQSNRTLPPGTKIIDVFDEAGGSLLILGEPGSGKTTMLLELTRQLTTRAQSDPSLAIPVVFNLSSWTEKRLPLEAWLIEELNTKYNIPKKIVRPWVENDNLILLLDGLDEVTPERRKACVEAINEFRQEHLVPIVVCSRIVDYEALTARLKLQGAVLLQPLTSEQVERYLDAAGPELATVHTLLHDDPALQELGQSPLMLSIMTLAYRGLSSEALSGLETTEGRRKHLFETYVQRMFDHRGADERYSSQQTTRWLAWLAKKMQQHGQTVFLIENLQPSWLQTRRWRLTYAMIPQLGIGLILGLWFGLLGGLIVGSRPGIGAGLTLVGVGAGLMAGIFIWLILLGIYGLITGRISEFKDGPANDIRPVEALNWSWSNVLPQTRRRVKDGMVRGAIGFAVIVIAIVYGPQIFGPMIVMFGGLVGIGLLIIVNGFSVNIIHLKTKPNQGIRLSARNAIFVGIILGSFGMLSGILIVNAGSFDALLPPEVGSTSMWFLALSMGVFWGLFFGSMGVETFGGSSVFKHYLLRAILWQTGSMPREVARFLDYAAGHVFLRKVGGGYIFIHRLLMEHFASLEPETTEK